MVSCCGVDPKNGILLVISVLMDSLHDLIEDMEGMDSNVKRNLHPFFYSGFSGMGVSKSHCESFSASDTKELEILYGTAKACANKKSYDIVKEFSKLCKSHCHNKEKYVQILNRIKKEWKEECGFQNNNNNNNNNDNNNNNNNNIDDYAKETNGYDSNEDGGRDDKTEEGKKLMGRETEVEATKPTTNKDSNNSSNSYNSYNSNNSNYSNNSNNNSSGTNNDNNNADNDDPHKVIEANYKKGALAYIYAYALVSLVYQFNEALVTTENRVYFDSLGKKLSKHQDINKIAKELKLITPKYQLQLLFSLLPKTNQRIVFGLVYLFQKFLTALKSAPKTTPAPIDLASKDKNESDANFTKNSSDSGTPCNNNRHDNDGNATKESRSDDFKQRSFHGCENDDSNYLNIFRLFLGPRFFNARTKDIEARQLQLYVYSIPWQPLTANPSSSAPPLPSSSAISPSSLASRSPYYQQIKDVHQQHQKDTKKSLALTSLILTTSSKYDLFETNDITLHNVHQIVDSITTSNSSEKITLCYQVFEWFHQQQQQQLQLQLQQQSSKTTAPPAFAAETIDLSETDEGLLDLSDLREFSLLAIDRIDRSEDPKKQHNAIINLEVSEEKKPAKKVSSRLFGTMKRATVRHKPASHTFHNSDGHNRGTSFALSDFKNTLVKSNSTQNLKAILAKIVTPVGLPIEQLSALQSSKESGLHNFPPLFVFACIEALFVTSYQMEPPLNEDGKIIDIDYSTFKEDKDFQLLNQFHEQFCILTMRPKSIHINEHMAFFSKFEWKTLFQGLHDIFVDMSEPLLTNAMLPLFEFVCGRYLTHPNHDVVVSETIICMQAFLRILPQANRRLFQLILSLYYNIKKRNPAFVTATLTMWNTLFCGINFVGNSNRPASNVMITNDRSSFQSIHSAHNLSQTEVVELNSNGTSTPNNLNLHNVRPRDNISHSSNRNSEGATLSSLTFFMTVADEIGLYLLPKTMERLERRKTNLDGTDTNESVSYDLTNYISDVKILSKYAHLKKKRTELNSLENSASQQQQQQQANSLPNSPSLPSGLPQASRTLSTPPLSTSSPTPSNSSSAHNPAENSSESTVTSGMEQGPILMEVAATTVTSEGATEITSEALKPTLVLKSPSSSSNLFLKNESKDKDKKNHFNTIGRGSPFKNMKRRSSTSSMPIRYINDEQEYQYRGLDLSKVARMNENHSFILPPAIITVTVEYLIQHGTEVEGLFRIPGRSRSAIDILQRLSQKNKDDVQGMAEILVKDKCSPHLITAVLTKYIRDLPDSLLTKALLPYFESVVSCYSATDMDVLDIGRFYAEILSYKFLISLLPPVNRNSVFKILELLVAVRDADNKMNSSNIDISCSSLFCGVKIIDLDASQVAAAALANSSLGEATHGKKEIIKNAPVTAFLLRYAEEFMNMSQYSDSEMTKIIDEMRLTSKLKVQLLEFIRVWVTAPELAS
eukprot:Awhi_evm1s6502